MNEKKVNRMSEQITDNIADGLAKSIAKVLQPVFEDISNTLIQVVETVKQQQQESTEQMVNSFLSELQHKSVDAFSGITNQIGELSELFEKNMLTLNVIMQNLQQQSEQNATLLQHMKEQQKEQHNQNQNYLKEQQKQCDLLKELMQNATSLLNRQTKLFEESKTQELESREVTKQQQQKLYDNMTKQTIAIVDETRQQITAITAQWSKRQEEMSNHLAVIHEECMRQQNTFAKDYSECSHVLDEQAASSLQVLKDTATTMKSYGEALQLASKQLLSSFDEFNENMEQSVVKVFKAMDEQLSQIAKTLSDTAGEINESAAAIPKALKCSIEQWKS